LRLAAMWLAAPRKNEAQPRLKSYCDASCARGRPYSSVRRIPFHFHSLELGSTSARHYAERLRVFQPMFALRGRLMQRRPFRRSFNPAIAHFRRLSRVLRANQTYSAFMRRQAYPVEFKTRAPPTAMTRLDHFAKWHQRLNEEMAHSSFGSVIFATTRAGPGLAHAVLLLPSSELCWFEQWRRTCASRKSGDVRISRYDAAIAEGQFRRVAGNAWMWTGLSL
jgi:hypothetical protein